MAVVDLFSKRKRREEMAGEQEIYVYDKVPHHLRVQIVHILRDAIGNPKAVGRPAMSVFMQDDGQRAGHQPDDYLLENDRVCRIHNPRIQASRFGRCTIHLFPNRERKAMRFFPFS
ncbi:MAG: hypothetical protein PHY92_03585 [Alphaproteobacteria bacterium]|nr:hypothetical protein [Alphaproteobacteria bacterium]